MAGARGAMMKRMLRNTLDPSQALLRRRGKVEGGVLRNGLSLYNICPQMSLNKTDFWC